MGSGWDLDQVICHPMIPYRGRAPGPHRVGIVAQRDVETVSGTTYHDPLLLSCSRLTPAQSLHTARSLHLSLLEAMRHYGNVMEDTDPPHKHFLHSFYGFPGVPS